MTTTLSELIHPTAVIGPEADLAPDVQVGPYALIEGPVRVGEELRHRGSRLPDRPPGAGPWELRRTWRRAGQGPPA